MSNIDKIRREIKRRVKFHDDAMKACASLNNIALIHSAGLKEDEELIAFIDSLQQEQPETDLDTDIEMKKESESDEDERIRKAIIELLKEVGRDDTGISENAKCMIAYLEKQKESLPISEICKENANSFIDGIIEVRSFQRGMEEGRRLERQKEQKQAQTSEEKEYVRTIKSIISDFIRDKKPENLAYYQRIYDWLDGRHVPFSCGHENGKPADCVFSKQEYESYPIISTDTTSAKPADLDGKALLYTADKSYQIGFRDGVASVKPAEWSEEDEHIANILEFIVGKNRPDEIFKIGNKQGISAYKMCSWLKHLPERINLQPKQEWSEEDEHRRDGIIQWLREYQAKFNPKYDSLSIESIESLIDWLKSLRPSWKPSEEQMDRLSSIVAALRKVYCDDMADFLASIYHNLKKLM